MQERKKDSANEEEKEEEEAARSRLKKGVAENWGFLDPRLLRMT